MREKKITLINKNIIHIIHISDSVVRWAFSCVQANDICLFRALGPLELGFVRCLLQWWIRCTFQSWGGSIGFFCQYFIGVNFFFIAIAIETSTTILVSSADKWILTFSFIPSFLKPQCAWWELRSTFTFLISCMSSICDRNITKSRVIIIITPDSVGCRGIIINIFGFTYLLLNQ